jgi:hypothetical protein
LLTLTVNSALLFSLSSLGIFAIIFNAFILAINCENNVPVILSSLSFSGLKYLKIGVKIVFEENGIQEQVPFDSSVSMNFWCFPPSMFVTTENLFHEFVRENFADIKAEFFIPLLGDNFVQNQGGSIQVIPTSAQWFGVTYKEDAPIVKASVEKLVSDGGYPISLWA